MTLVVAWINKETGSADSIWAIADTRISNGNETITLEGSKF